ncbi:MAG TPA: hypothetical protein VM489_17035, partial [Burkholderiales bacterium]|nr:hypothetical protein [Burkholderiales bacterium]
RKLALAHLGAAGGSWCLASDEGAYLRGTDTAPAPLMHWAAGVHAELAHRAGARGTMTIDFGYAVSGSFAQGRARGEAFAPEIRLGEAQDPAALDASPLHQAMRTPLANTFALYVNGRRRSVTGVASSAAPDEEDPFLKHGGAPQALHEPRPPLIGKEPLDPEAKIFSMPVSTGGLRFASRVEGVLEDGLVRNAVTFPGIPASRFTFVADALGRRAPSGLAYAWAGVAFCYLTQISRYIEARKLGVSAARLVQRGPLAGPVDTHLFLNGAAEEGTMQELLAIAAGTCYLHVTLAGSLVPTVHTVANRG